MEKRLVSAYDKMVMPDGCSQRIEEALRQKLQPERGRYTTILRPVDRRKAWRSSLAGICLAVLLMVGGTVLFIKAQGRLRDSGALTAPSATENTAATEKPPWSTTFPYGAEAERFLMDMCRYMPDWSGASSLDDYFWRDFLYNSFSNVKKSDGIMVQTVIGEVPCLGGMVMVSREQAQAYAMLATGLELPEFSTDTMGGNVGFSYTDGHYRITPRENNVVKLENISLEISLHESDAYNVIFRVDARSGDKTLSTNYVSFYLKPVENAHGFVIQAKSTSQDLYSYENREIEEVARAFGEAYFANDVETMYSLMTSRSDWNIYDIYNILLSQYTDNETQFEVSEVGVYKGLVETLGGNPVAYVRYRYLLPGETAYADAVWALCLEMEETKEGWKVRYYQEKQLDEMFADKEKLRDVLEEFARAYAGGSQTGVRTLMRDNAPENLPVYDGEQNEYDYWYVTIFGVNPGAVPKAQARIDFRFSAEDENRSLAVNLVRLEEGWVVDSYLEKIPQDG